MANETAYPKDNTNKNIINTITVGHNDLSRKFEIEDERDFEENFLEAVDIAKKDNLAITIQHYKDFIKNINLLKLLNKENISFKIGDYDSLNSGNLGVVLEHLSLARLARKKKMLAVFDSKRRNGDKLGNPDLARIAKKETAEHRIKKAAFSTENINAAYRIFELRNQNIAYNKIADIVNDEGFKTRRKGKFYAKSIQRIEDRYKELYKNFEIEDKELLKKIETQNINELFEKFKNGHDYSERIKLENSKVNFNDLTIEILNNKTEVVQEKVESSRLNAFVIPISGYSKILPGQYILKVNYQNKDYYGNFYAGKEVMSIVEGKKEGK